MFPISTDTRWSWVIAFSCCLINCLMYGMIRLSGLLLVATVSSFQVTRAEAVLPFTVCTSVRNLSGIFVGYLGDKFGLRYVILSGCFLAALGVGLCFFASDILWMTVCWGGIFGFGSGLATCLLPLAINQFFNRHRGTASGISYSGGYIGSFIFPAIVVQLLDSYGLQGAFIVLSGVLLNGLAISLLFPTSHSKLMPANQQTTSNNCVTRRLSGVTSSDTISYCRKVWSKLKKYARGKCALMNSNDLTKAPKTQAIQLTNSVFLSDTYSYQCTSESGTEFQKNFTDLSVPQNNKVLITAMFDVNKISTFREIPNNSTFYNLDFKETSYNKYKTKIWKINKFLFFGSFQRSYSFHAFLLQTPMEDVKLIYFLNFHRHNFRPDTIPNANSTILNSSQLYKHYKRNNQMSQFNEEDGISKTELSNYRHDTGTKSFQMSVKSDEPTARVLSRKKSAVSFFQQNDCKNQPPISCDTSNHNSTSKKDDASQVKLKVAKNFANCCFGWCFMYTDPMFVLIATTMSLHTFVVVCTLTIIEDFAKDLKVPHSQGYYVLMALSTADLIGALTLGVITDRGFMSRCSFLVLCFLGTGVSSIAIAFSNNLRTLLILVSFYGIFETGVIITFPLIIAQFIQAEKQATALASSSVLSSPTVLLVPLVIGYFRDQNGCYFGVFFVLAMSSFICSLTWLLAPFLISKYKAYSLRPHPYTLPV